MLISLGIGWSRSTYSGYEFGLIIFDSVRFGFHLKKITKPKLLFFKIQNQN